MITIQTLTTSWQTVATFDPLMVEMDIITNCALHIADKLVGCEMCFVSDVCVIDDETGEVFWSFLMDCQPNSTDWDGDYWDDGCSVGNEDAGYDPYMGCYTDDC